VARAKRHFAEADALMAASPRRTVRTPRVMAAAYRSMLDAMIARGWRSPRTPVRLRKSQLIWIVLRHAII
jgi:phytoene synthase